MGRRYTAKKRDCWKQLGPGHPEDRKQAAIDRIYQYLNELGELLSMIPEDTWEEAEKRLKSEIGDNMFYCYNNNRTADKIGYPCLNGEGWETSEFDSFETAVAYANKWLGAYAPNKFELNIPYDYNGFGDTFLISDKKLSD